MKSYLNGFTNMIGGEFRPNEFYSLYAQPSTGKTLYLLGEAYNALAQNYKVVWIDTETGFKGMSDAWEKRYRERFKTTLEDENFHYVRLFSFEEFEQFFNEKIHIMYSKKGKLTISRGENLLKTEVPTQTLQTILGRKKNVLFILDSFSAMMREQFGSAPENFAGRSDATGFLFMTLAKAMKKHDGTSIIAHHATINPLDRFHSKATIRGGSAVEYYSKYILYLEKSNYNVLEDYRKLYGVRTPVARDWTLEEWFQIKDDGYYDATEDHVAELIANRRKQVVVDSD